MAKLETGTVRRPLQPLPEGYKPDRELEMSLRFAAWIGFKARKVSPLSYSSFLIALLNQPGSAFPVSRWFQTYAKEVHVNRQAIFDTKGFKVEEAGRLQSASLSGRLPAVNPLYSGSIWSVLVRAAKIAAQFSRTAVPLERVIGVRHVMAAYACYSPPEHDSQLEEWGLVVARWRVEFLRYATEAYPGEKWESFGDSFFGNSNWRKGPRSSTARSAPKKKKKKRSPATEQITIDIKQAVKEPVEEPNAEASNFGDSNVGDPAIDAQLAAATLFGRYTADNPFATTVADLLNVEQEAAAFARLVAARDVPPPLAIGVFGNWGSGKTYFMRKMREEIDAIQGQVAAESADPLNPPSLPFHGDIVQIQFDAWHYAEENLWASLVEYIFQALDSWMLSKSADDPAGVELVFDRLATTRQLKLDALESLVLRRSERQTAEARAQRTRAQYQQAVARSEATRPASYLLTAIGQLVSSDEKADAVRKEVSESLGLPELRKSNERLEDAIKEARTESGRARLVFSALTAKFGTPLGIAVIVGILFVIPVTTTFLTEFIAQDSTKAWLQQIHGWIVGATTLITGVSISLAAAVKRVRAGLAKLEEFDNLVQEQIEQQRKQVEASAVATEDRKAQDELQKSRQAFESAEKALAAADANLLAARQDFESGTARGRLKQFIRSKVTSGEYAKHLGIVASIRRDFSQLASLMSDSNDDSAEQAERERLASDALTRVTRFIDWLSKAKDMKLTEREMWALLSSLEPEDALQVLADHRSLFIERLEGQPEQLEAIENRLGESIDKTPKMLKFSRIVLYIDDLDRCEAKKVVDVLQAVHLLLSFPLFVVVVAVDSRWVSQALLDHYPGLLGDSIRPGVTVPEWEGRAQPPTRKEAIDLHSKLVFGARRATPSASASSYDYLEKIFQIPYWVRPMDHTASRRYVHSIASRDLPPSLAAPKIPPLPGEHDEQDVRQTADPGADGQVAGNSQDGIEGGSPPNQADEQGTNGSKADAVKQALEGLTLEEFEVNMLAKYAPFVGATPRRAIRFVNIYRLIKTSLPPESRTRLLGAKGESAGYRALIAQLALSNGMPQAANYYFEKLASLGPEAAFDALRNELLADARVTNLADASGLMNLVDSLVVSGNDIQGAEPITIRHLLDVVEFARRYAFEQ